MVSIHVQSDCYPYYCEDVIWQYKHANMCTTVLKQTIDIDLDAPVTCCRMYVLYFL